MSRPLASLIAEALDLVARECPAAHARAGAALGARRVELGVGDELVGIELEPAPAGLPAVAVRASADTLCALLAGEVELEGAVLAYQLEVTGAPDALAAAGEAMTWFLEGAVRCGSIEPLVDELFSRRAG